MTEKNKERYFTAKDVAKRFMVSPITVKQWAQKGLIKAQLTPGGHRRFSYSDINAFAATYNIDLPTNSENPSILLVDDDVGILGLLKDIFSTNIPHASVKAVDNGFKAGLTAHEIKPDIIFVDLMMPGINGFEVCQLIRSTPPLSHCRIVAMTGFPNPDSVNKIIDAGASICLQKPFTQQQVLDACKFKITTELIQNELTN